MTLSNLRIDSGTNLLCELFPSGQSINSVGFFQLHFVTLAACKMKSMCIYLNVYWGKINVAIGYKCVESVDFYVFLVFL